ncbi:MAG: sugar phosphate isomerase/epimerase family protein [Bacteroidales bacterium]|jgi:sugar phosphate isomerase/epimerase|nr:sugar phosphate isomerase/epimerase [Bacteroidales bacterium]MDI9553374.1 sugar phosphate isomerase/epimerase [Bacteroidota bacterium]HPB13354.1 sugar phosphate isomerase/epimerase [Bacteroidales bacterium]
MMKKTTLISFVMLLALGSFVLVNFNSCKSPAGKNIGLQLYSIRDSINRDVPAAIEKVADMGYTFVEMAGYRDGKFYGMDPAEFSALCQKNGLQVLSSHTGRSLPDSAGYEEAMAWWDQCIDAHYAAGVKFIVQPSMDRSAYESIENISRWCAYFNEVGEKCNAKGIRFGYHNHANEFTTVFGDTILYDFMLQNTDPEKVMFELDLYWCVEGGKNPVDYFNKYPGRFELWHIKDKEEIGASGMMDFETMWTARDISGMKYGIVEVERYNFDQFTSCAKSYEFLNNAEYIQMPL